MNGTKIFVLQLKQIIKILIILAIALVATLFLLFVFLPKDEESNAQYNPGTYTSEMILYDSPVYVEVTVTDERVIL